MTDLPLGVLLSDLGFELVVSRYMAPEPALEREYFSGGVNLSASERNRKRLGETCKVYSVVSMPSKLFCAPWVHSLIMAGMASDADDRIDALYARQWKLEQVGGKTSRGFLAMRWKIHAAESIRAKQMSECFWRRNPRTENVSIDDENLSGVRLPM